MELPAWLQIAFMILSSCLSLVVAYLGTKIKKLQERKEEEAKQTAKEEEAFKTGIRSMLRDRLIYICYKCKEKNCITVDELENLADIFKSYDDLEGNVAVTKLYKETIALPLDANENVKYI